ncbi:MAG: hypothetical protein PHU97_11385, partial [Bacteroidales bacterium]|nr:hypothetical protein [Bacteroidales bacterium]
MKKKKTFSFILLFVMLCCPVMVIGQYHYQKFNTEFNVFESHGYYEVEALHTGNISSSRMLNALKKRLRMQALDLIGTYQVYLHFAQENGLNGDYFQLFASYTSFQFDASAERLIASEFKTTDQGRTVHFKIKKEDFQLRITEYPYQTIDIHELMVRDFNKKSTREKAIQLYDYKDFTSDDYLMLVHHYLSGRSMVSTAFQALVKQQTDSRLELSVLQTPDSLSLLYMDTVSAEAKILSPLFRQIMYTELVTSAPLQEKDLYYREFLGALGKSHSTWERMLLFCGERRPYDVSSLDDPTLYSVILGLPGAINPYAVRYSLEREIYNKAEEQFGREKLEKALDFLQQSINYEGIHTRTLNLTGATYRLLGQPEKAMPFLILAYMIDPSALFVAGNLGL